MSNKASTINHPSQTVYLNDKFKLLVACCQTNPSKENIEYIQGSLSTIDQQQLTSMANSHGVLPLVYKTLKKQLTIDHQPSTEILSALKQKYLAISQRNMLMSAELIRIMKVFKESGIDALVFKGPVLSQIAYGDITLRQFGDLDILIRKKDRSAMMALLIREHYIPEIDLNKETEETFFECVNVIGLHKASTGIRVEVHWELLSKNYAIDWKEKSLWAKEESVQINHKEIPVLPFDQQLLYLCAHGAKHLFERLEWICDIDRSIRTTPDINWKHLLNEADKLGIKRMLLLGLALSRHFFGSELPDMIRKNITQDKEIPKLISKVIKTHFSDTSKEEKSYSSFGLLWSMRENFSDQLRFTWRALFAAKFDDFVFIQLPKNLTFLYHLIRPYRLITKYFKR